MADIPEGLDDLLNSIRGEGKSSGSSALAVIPKPEKKESDSVENEDIDPRILKLLGLEDVFDIDYDTYKTLLRERMAAGRMPDSKIPTEEVQLLTDEFKRVKSKTGRFKVKGQKIKKESFVGKKKPTVTKPVKALPGKVTPKDVVDAEEIKPDSKEPIDEVLGQLALKINKVDNNIKDVINSSIEKDEKEKDIQDDQRIEEDKAKKKEKEQKRESAGLGRTVSSVITKALAPAKGMFDFLSDFFDKFLFGTVVAEIIRFLKNPIEYFRPIVEWMNNTINSINDGVAKLIKSVVDPINAAIKGFNDKIASVESNINGFLSKIKAPPLDLGRIPDIKTDSILNAVKIPNIPYPTKEEASGKSAADYLGDFSGLLTNMFGLGSAGSTPQLQSGPGNFSGNNNQQKAMNYFMSQGLTKQQAAGIVGNLMQESTAGLDPMADNKMGNKGIAQWDANRWSRFEKWAKTKGLNVNTLEAQLQWVMEELRTGSGGLSLKTLQGSRSASSAAALFNERFERSGEGPGDPGYQNRIRNAEGLMNMQLSTSQLQSSAIKSSGSPTPPGPPQLRQPAVASLYLPGGGSNSASPTAVATGNQKQVPIFSPENGTDQYSLAIASTYNLVGGIG